MNLHSYAHTQQMDVELNADENEFKRMAKIKGVFSSFLLHTSLLGTLSKVTYNPQSLRS